MGQYVTTMLLMMVIVWAGTEGLALSWGKIKPKKAKRRKDRLSMAIGPVTGVVAYGAGFLPTPVPGFFAWLFAAVMGFLASMGAGILNDYGVRAFKKAK